jgi:hypothetical protein
MGSKKAYLESSISIHLKIFFGHVLKLCTLPLHFWSQDISVGVMTRLWAG